MSEKGKLYGVGVGPGDVELLTLKAAKILKTVPVICSPKSSKEKESIALSIVEPIIDEREDRKNVMLVEPIFPMIEDDETLEKVWDSAAELIAHYLDSGRDLAFVTLGDPSIFSTFSYVQKRLKDRYEIEVIPGITSFTRSSPFWFVRREISPITILFSSTSKPKDSCSAFLLIFLFSIALLAS